MEAPTREDELRDPDVGTAPEPAVIALRVSREQVLVGLVVLLQAVWLAALVLPGWYSGADLPNLAAATGRQLDWGYLSGSLGGHFGPGQRLVYWLLERVAPLDWGLTVALRLAFQAAATVLLWQVLVGLLGRRRWLLPLLVLYAASPLLVPGTAVLNSGLGLGIAQVCVLGALLVQVRDRPRSWAGVAVVGVLVLVAVTFAQQVLPVLLALPVVALWRGLTASTGALSVVRRQVASFAAAGVALLVLAVLYVSGDYGSTQDTNGFGPADAAWLVGKVWVDVLGTATVGGPWRFTSFVDQWSGYADPPLVAVVLGQVVLLALLVVTVRRARAAALVAWVLPVGVGTGTYLLVASGRWSVLEELLPAVLRYAYFLPLALVLGLALALGAPSVAVPARPRTPRPRALAAATAVLVVLSAVSSLGFARWFWDNPAEGYVGTLSASVRARGPDVPLYDVRVPEGVVPFISAEHFVSDVLGLARVPAQYGGQAAQRLLPLADGRLGPATFTRVADLTGPRRPDCGVYVSGTGTTTVPLGAVEGPNEWWLQLEAYQPRGNVLALEVRDADGRQLAVGSGSPTLRTSGQLVVLHRRLELGRPASLTLRSTDPGTNLCLVHAYVGVPLPARDGAAQ